jgi:hypothetical protein
LDITFAQTEIKINLLGLLFNTLDIVGKYLLNVNVEAEHGIGGSLRELLTILHNQDRIRCILEGVILILVGV